jgi:hypothetical protein
MSVAGAGTFVAELVDDGELSNTVALNSTSFNAARMVGPAVAGIIIASLRTSELRPNARAHRAKGGMMEGFRYVWSRRDLGTIMITLFLIGTFGLNFPIFISTMAVSVFHTDARGFGLLSSTMAVGTISCAVLAAGRAQLRFVSLLLESATFGAGCKRGARLRGRAGCGPRHVGAHRGGSPRMKRA